MPEPTTQSLLKRLVLSASELREMTDWPGALIEDYLNILDDIITLAGILDGIVDQTAGVKRVTSSYSIQFEDGTIFANTDFGNITLFLPAGTLGEAHRIINTGKSGNAVTLVPNGTERLNGYNESEILYDGENLDLQYETSEGWF